MLWKQQKSLKWTESSFERGGTDSQLPSGALWAWWRPSPEILVGRGMASFLRWVKRFRCEQHFCLGLWLTSLAPIRLGALGQFLGNSSPGAVGCTE